MKNYPKIGIRPTIDGRQGGVRESLEEKTMNLAKAVAELISSNVKYSDGTPVQCVIADGTIGRVGETAACQAKFEREGVGATISVTSCWCYGSETMDMHPYWPKAVWGFNGTERPGAVYLAAVLAAHAQKGLPAFGIYGHDVQDLDDNTIPEDVAEKILRWARSAIAVAQMRGESYLSIGSQCMGIAGSIIDQDFFQEYLGMRNESVDEVEILRRMDEGIYDKEEYAKAMAWVEKYCKPNEGWDKNRPEKQKDRPAPDAGTHPCGAVFCGKETAHREHGAVRCETFPKTRPHRRNRFRYTRGCRLCRTKTAPPAPLRRRRPRRIPSG